MTGHALHNLAVLDKFKSAPFPPGYPSAQRSFYSPVDDIHGALKYLLNSATKSLVVAMYGFDDPELADILHSKLIQDHLFVQLTLDKSQAGGVHERTILADQKYPASSIAVGSSEHGRIQHMKLAIIDGVFVVGGSTNWSDAAERLQDNEMHVTQDPYIAAEARARIDVIHQNILAKAKA